MAKRDVIHKPEVHEVSQSHDGTTELRPQRTCTQNFNSFRDMLADRQTHTHTDRNKADHNTPLPYQDRVNKWQNSRKSAWEGDIDGDGAKNLLWSLCQISIPWCSFNQVCDITAYKSMKTLWCTQKAALNS